MKFKLNDRVVSARYGVGTIEFIEDGEYPIAVWWDWQDRNRPYTYYTANGNLDDSYPDESSIVLESEASFGKDKPSPVLTPTPIQMLSATHRASRRLENCKPCLTEEEYLTCVMCTEVMRKASIECTINPEDSKAWILRFKDYSTNFDELMAIYESRLEHKE